MKRMYPLVLDIVRQYETNNPYELCKFMNISVVHTDSIGSYGLLVKVLNKKIILIHSDLDNNQRSVVLAHELGHVILHKGGYHLFDIHKLSASKQDKKEYEANKFAFLLIAHTCLRNNPTMIDSIKGEKTLTLKDTLELLKTFSKESCFIRRE